MTKYFTSDTHFAHPFVAALRGYAKPGFTSDNTIKQQANEAHMQVKDCVNWYQHDIDVTNHINEMVGENDELYILGDLYSGSAWSLQQALMHVKSLRCPRNNRHLILGNHDDVLYGKSKGFKELTEAFGEIGRIGMRDITDGETVMPVFLCTSNGVRTSTFPLWMGWRLIGLSRSLDSMPFRKWGRTCDCCTVTPMRACRTSSRIVTKSTWDWMLGV